MTKLLTLTAASLGLILAGCGGDDSSETTSSGTGETATTATVAEEPKGSAAGTTIKPAGSDLGQVLFDADDQAIYIFDKESGAKSECYGACAEAWPPVLTDGDPQAGAGAKASLLGTTQRTDGTTQVTYNGHPLYYYAHEGPGEVTCHNVDEFGGLWLAVDAAGNAI